MTYTLLNNPPAPDYASFRSPWHPQKDVKRISLFYQGGQKCPQSLYDAQENPLATLKSCQAPETAVSNQLVLKSEKAILQADYELTAPLPFGATQFKIKTLDPIPAQIASSHGTNHEIIAISNQHLKFGDLFRQLWGRGKFNTSFFFLALILLSFGWLLAKQSSKVSLVLTLLSISLALLGLMPKFSGNDETAHFSMLVEATSERTPVFGDGANRISHLYASARDLMFLDDFFKLHKVYPQPQGACPHQIIGGCGITEKPKNFYNKYFAWLSFASIESLGVGKMLTLVRLQNLLAFLILIFLSVSFLRLNLEYAVPIFVFFSSAFSSLIALSNDVFGVFLGIFLTSYQFWLMKKKGTLRARIGLTLVGFFLFYLGTKVDSNAFAALPVLGASILFLVSSSISTNLFSNKKLWQGLALIFLPIFSLALFVFTRHFVFKYASTLLLPHLGFLEDSRVIQFLGTVPLQTSLGFILTFLKGMLGQFNWSHTSYPTEVGYLLIGCVFLFTAYSISRSFLRKEPSKSEFNFDSRLLFCLLMQAVVFALLVDSIGSYGSTTAPGAWSFLVTRFFYPGVAIVFVPIILAIESYSSERRTQVMKVIHFASLSWATVNIIYFYPNFFLASAW